MDVPAATWEGCTGADLASHWALPAVHLFSAVGSTSDVARRLAQEGAPSGTLVIADEQLAGRGRGSRSWASPAGLGLWCSLVLRGLAADTIGLLPIRVALAAAAALDPWAGAPIRVKWPNDLLVGDRKLGGILCEASWDGHRLDHMIVGVGLNLLQAPEDFPEPIRPLATSLRAASGEPVSRFQVAGALIAALRPVLDDDRIGELDGVGEVADAFAARDALAGRRVEIREGDTERVLASGRASGIDDDGSLLVETGVGQVTRVRSGTVHIPGGWR